MISWFVKALNANPEIMAYLANEGSRPKYFPEERSRAQRPDLIKFTRFVADVGMTYTAIGDCSTYRPTIMNGFMIRMKSFSSVSGSSPSKKKKSRLGRHFRACGR